MTCKACSQLATNHNYYEAMRVAPGRIHSSVRTPTTHGFKAVVPCLRKGLARPAKQQVSAAALESLSLDKDGELTWDVATMPPEDRERVSWSADSVLDGYMLRPGQVPAAAPTSTLPTRPDSLSRSKKPVVLVRDTNAWCPFCERVSHNGAGCRAVSSQPTWSQNGALTSTNVYVAQVNDCMCRMPAQSTLAFHVHDDETWLHSSFAPCQL